MIIPHSQAVDKPSKIAAEGHMALGRGDIDRARACYLEAGKLFEADIANERKQSEKHLLRFLAASQYYHGGHYDKALALGRKIEARFLDGKARELLPQFMKDATARAKPNYVAKMRQTVAKLWQRAEYQAIIELFQQHRYVLPSPELAAMRALCCEQMKQYRAAALFFGDAVRMSSQRPDIVFLAVSYIYFMLFRQNQLTEAKEYLAHLVKEVPHALTFAGASLLRHFEAASPMKTDEQRKLSEEQVRLFEKAFALYNDLPASHREDLNFRNALAETAAAAAVGFVNLGQRNRALEICDWAHALSPDLPAPREIQRLITEGNHDESEPQAAWLTPARDTAVGNLSRPAA
jgi:tetratricopeptide (TPR) repeat protein